MKGAAGIVGIFFFKFNCKMDQNKHQNSENDYPSEWRSPQGHLFDDNFRKMTLEEGLYIGNLRYGFWKIRFPNSNDSNNSYFMQAGLYTAGERTGQWTTWLVPRGDCENEMQIKYIVSTGRYSKGLQVGVWTFLEGPGETTTFNFGTPQFLRDGYPLWRGSMYPPSDVNA